MSIKDIVETIARYEDGKYVIDDPRLNIFPRTLEADVMGYRTNEKYITSFDVHMPDYRSK